MPLETCVWKITNVNEGSLTGELEDAKLIKQNQSDTCRCDVLHKETIGSEEMERHAAFVRQFGFQDFSVDAMPDKDAGEHTSERQHDFSGQKIEAFKECHPEKRTVFHQSERERAEYGQNTGAERYVDGCPLAFDAMFFVNVGRGYFVQRDGRRQRRYAQKEVEAESPYVSERHPGEDVGQRNKYEGDFLGRFDTEMKDGRKNHHSGQQRYDRIEYHHLDCSTLQVGFFMKIRTVRNQASHADAERKECLPHGAEHDGRVDFPEIGFEKKLQPFASARKHQAAYAQYEHDDEE